MGGSGDRGGLVRYHEGLFIDGKGRSPTHLRLLRPQGRGGTGVASREGFDGGGFDVWLDTQRLKAGDRRTQEIEAALDVAGVVLALLSDGSFASDTCRAQQGWALDAGKRVIPVKVHRDAKAQLRLHGLLWLDFSDVAKYDERLEELAESGRLPACPTRRSVVAC